MQQPRRSPKRSCRASARSIETRAGAWPPLCVHVETGLGQNARRVATHACCRNSSRSFVDGGDTPLGNRRVRQRCRAFRCERSTRDGVRWRTRSIVHGGSCFLSTADIDTPLIGNSVAWSIQNGRLAFVHMSPLPGRGDPRFRTVRTISQAVALMAPGLPPTDATQRRQDASTLVITLVFALTCCSALRMTARSSS